MPPLSSSVGSSFGSGPMRHLSTSPIFKAFASKAEPSCISLSTKASGPSGSSYRPFPKRLDGPTPLELRFAARSMGPASHVSMALEDVTEGKEYLQATLGHYPQDILQMAYAAKRADRDCVVHQVAQTAAEIESLERHRLLLSAIQRHQESDLAVEETLLEVIRSTLSPRSLQDVEDDSGFYRAVFADELIALTTAETQLEHVEQVITV